MNLKPLILLLIIATCHSLQIDDIRNEFFKIESKVWNEILDEKHLDSTNEQSKNRAGIALIKEFKRFDNLISQHYPHTLEYGLDFLQRLWEWEVIRSYELGNVYNLYETFRRMELRQIDNGLITEDMVWTDFNASVSEFQYVDQLGNRLQEIIFNDQIFENALKVKNSFSSKKLNQIK